MILFQPESDTDIVEVLQSAIPLLEGLSDVRLKYCSTLSSLNYSSRFDYIMMEYFQPEEEGGVDIPAVLLPLSQKLSEVNQPNNNFQSLLSERLKIIFSGPRRTRQRFWRHFRTSHSANSTIERTSFRSPDRSAESYQQWCKNFILEFVFYS